MTLFLSALPLAPQRLSTSAAVPYILLLAPAAAVQIPTSRIDFDLAPLTALFFSFLLILLLLVALPWSLGKCTSAIGLHLLLYRRLVFSTEHSVCGGPVVGV